MTLVGNPHACTFASRTSYSFSHLNPRKFPCLVSVRSPLHLPLHRLPACWSLRVSAPLSFIHSLKLKVIFRKLLKSQRDGHNQKSWLAAGTVFIICISVWIRMFHYSKSFKTLCDGIGTSFFFQTILRQQTATFVSSGWKLPHSSHCHISIRMHDWQKRWCLWWRSPKKNKSADKDQQRVEKRDEMEQELETD